ncbi:MAG TPA: hypothetical protein VHZ07_19210 [Bryobacteraceae bacterium]|nr:hypothetical protein [Bryobacteraceae bacterium]
MLLLIILPLVASQYLAFWSYRTRRKSLAYWALSACLLFIVGAVIFEVPLQFVPATYEKMRIRQSAFFDHVILAAVEFAVCILVGLSALWPKRLNFWVIWGLNLAVIAAFYLVFLYSLSGPTI